MFFFSAVNLNWRVSLSVDLQYKQLTDLFLLLPDKKPVAGRIKLEQGFLNCHLLIEIILHYPFKKRQSSFY